MMSRLLMGLLAIISMSTYAQTLFDNNVNINSLAKDEMKNNIKKVDYIEVDENGHSTLPNKEVANINKTTINKDTVNSSLNDNKNSNDTFQVIDNTKPSNSQGDVLFGTDSNQQSGDNNNDNSEILFDNSEKKPSSVHILTVDTSAIVAFQSGNLQAVQNWLDKGTAIDMPVYDKNTLAMIAAMHSQDKIFNLAIEHKANLMIKNKNNETVLHWISYNNNTDLLNQYIAAIGLDKLKNAINLPDNFGRTPLHYALMSDKENPAFIERLIQLGGNLNIQDSEGNTPVHMAFWKNHKDVYSVLKKYNASFYIKNNADLTPIQLAAHVNSTWDFDYYSQFDPKNIK